MRDNLAGDLTAGIGAALAYLPLIVVVAILAFGALGPQAAVAISIAVFGANIVAGVVLLALARCALLVGTPTGSSAPVMAGLFGGLAAHGSAPDVADAMAITASVGVVAGAVQLLLVRAGAAGLGPLAPYPVVSGLVNGTAAWSCCRGCRRCAPTRSRSWSPWPTRRFSGWRFRRLCPKRKHQKADTMWPDTLAYLGMVVFLAPTNERYFFVA